MKGSKFRVQGSKVIGYCYGLRVSGRGVLVIKKDYFLLTTRNTQLVTRNTYVITKIHNLKIRIMVKDKCRCRVILS